MCELTIYSIRFGWIPIAGCTIEMWNLSYDDRSYTQWRDIWPQTHTHFFLSLTRTLSLCLFSHKHILLSISLPHTHTNYFCLNISLSFTHTHTHKHTHTFSLWHTQWCSYCSPTRYLSSLIFCISWTFLTVGSNKNSRNKIDGILLAKSDESGKWDVINFQKTN
jgi:hypothetical protein